jgi:alkanesulfonate monooxygenase SsuD/methylene tetrahydromethanopterin reductase-like flavin-dependent oxidoreductase (luciferase family)
MFGRLWDGHFLPPVTHDRYLAEVEHGSLCVGSPETVARKIAGAVTALGIWRFDMKYLTGPMPHGRSLDGIRLYGARKIRMVQELVAEAVVAA